MTTLLLDHTANELTPCTDHCAGMSFGVMDIAPSHILAFVMKFVLGSFPRWSKRGQLILTQFLM